LVISSLAVAVFASHAGADTLSNSDITVTIAATGDKAVSPLSDGELIDISVAANSTLDESSLEAAGYSSGADVIKVLECADSGGLIANLPTKPTECEPATIDTIAGDAANGSLFVNKFTVYALPDPAVLGASSGTICNQTHECVLGIFADQNNFSKPHIFSGPFLVTSSDAAGSLPSGSVTQGTSTNASTSANSAAAGATALPATLANTGSPTLWPWLLGSGAALLVGGTGLRLSRRRTT
jgi:hypothetical protein